MHGKFIQISTVVTNSGVALYALDEEGIIWEKLVGMPDSSWVRIP